MCATCYRYLFALALAAWLGLVAGSGSLGASPLRARSEAPHPDDFSLEVVGCPAPIEAELRRLIAIELRGSGARLRPRLRIRCAPAGTSVAARGPETGAWLERLIAPTPELSASRPRLIALAAAELVSGLRLRSSRPRAVLPSPGPPQQVVAPTPPSSARLRLCGLSRLALLTAPLVARFGGALVLGGDLSRRWGWRVEVEASHGGRALALGSALMTTLSAASAATLRLDWSRLRLSGGAGARLGATRFFGVATAPQEALTNAFWDLWAGPLLLAYAELGPYGGHLLVTFGLEAGYGLREASAEVAGERVLSHGGLWLSFGAGLGWAW